MSLDPKTIYDLMRYRDAMRMSGGEKKGKSSDLMGML